MSDEEYVEKVVKAMYDAFVVDAMNDVMVTRGLIKFPTWEALEGNSKRHWLAAAKRAIEVTKPVCSQCERMGNETMAICAKHMEYV